MKPRLNLIWKGWGLYGKKRLETGYFGRYCSVSRRKSATPFLFSSQKKAGYIRLVQIRDYKTDKYATYIPEKLAKRFCKQDDIMIGRYGPPIFQILRGIEGAYNVALIKALPQGVDKEFLYHTLKREDLFQYIDLLSRRTSGQTGVDLTNLKAFELSIPVLTDEQTAIAKALSDVDSLIVSLQRLIEKRKPSSRGQCRNYSPVKND